MANGSTELISNAFRLAPLIVFLPVIGIFIILIFKQWLGERGAGIVASIAAGLAFCVSVLLQNGLTTHHNAVIVPFAQWINVGGFDIQWAFRIDTLSVTMMLTVTGVGTLIHLYAIGYMHTDVRHNGDVGRYARFFVFFNLFIVAMMILVSANNYLMLFVGWEGVGLCSYLLIGFWFEKGEKEIANAKAAKKAFIVNRIGDFGLLIALFIMFWAFGSLKFDTVFDNAPNIAIAMPGALLAITLFMILGVTGKSAQLPLFVWLPDAMAGPTPVSALIHAATMVTAGIYLIARSAGLYDLVPLAQNIVMWVGALTALFAATIAVAQYDIKKVLAYSTISQLGFMVTAVGMGAYVAGMFHLVTHAFFKALLFLAAGSVIVGLERGHDTHHQSDDKHSFDPQDMRVMGNMRKRMPITFFVYVVGALALSGIAPLAGFFSKDEILAAAKSTSPAIYILLSFAALLTAFYMGRQLLLIFYGEERSEPAKHATESSPIIKIPLLVLALLSIIGGALNLPGFHALGHWLESTIEHGLEVEFSWMVALISLVFALIGLVLAGFVYGKKLNTLVDEKDDPLNKGIGPVFTAMNKKWWVDELYTSVIIKPYYFICDILAGPVDLSFIDGIAKWLGNLTKKTSATWSKLQNGYIRSYALAIFFGVVVVITYVLFK